ncbi:uncharacterized protein LOC125029922 [Penaeus chinensis]|uniref:uncharacterized protein LOC125029922 n=1 Tax=Penaeus chinensis TaxID=139456 RepID=UPI001FB5D93D|nr:uncharacterized protein LOC125029922 [Penaeus chinensis]
MPHTSNVCVWQLNQMEIYKFAEKRQQLKDVLDCKVLPGESVAKQHRPLVCKIKIKTIKSIQQKRIRKTKWWRLEESECLEKIVQRVDMELEKGERNWETVSDKIRKSAQETHRESSGNKKEGKETCLENGQDGINKALKIGKERNKNSQDVYQAKTIKKANGNILSIQPLEGELVERITETEVKVALRKMKNGKSVGPDIPADVWKHLGNTGVELLTKWFNDILNTGTMPEEWRTSTLIPIFKNKGDIQECGI